MDVHKLYRPCGKSKTRRRSRRRIFTSRPMPRLVAGGGAVGSSTGGPVGERQTCRRHTRKDRGRRGKAGGRRESADSGTRDSGRDSRQKIAPTSEDRRQRIRAQGFEVPAPATADTGDADFRKGEAYLYGRGAPENCDEAVKYLKAASAKSNAKARSAFGTMYATGHCVPRDLPTSYLWFALALRVDPNNQILEKDLNAVWNQMTPPERQMATRMKQ